MVFILLIILFSGIIDAKGPGSASGVFLNYNPSARGSAMANAYSALVEDSFSSYYNPAALTNIEKGEFSASYNKSIEDISNQYFSFSLPKRYGEVFSLGYLGLSYGKINGYDSVGYKTSDVEASDKAFLFSYGRSLTKDEIERPVLSLGATFKYAKENLDNASASAFAFDFGGLYILRPDNYWLKDIPGQEFRFSAVLKNFGTGFKFDKETSSLPMLLNLGAAWYSHPFGANRLILSSDIFIQKDEKAKVAFGAEYFLYQIIAVRFGYESVKYIGSKISAGIGFKLAFADIDYSFTPYGDLGAMNRFSATIRFDQIGPSLPLKGETARVSKAKLMAPKEKIEKLEVFASDYIKMAEKDIDNSQYLQAYENISKAFNLDPDLKKGKWGKYHKRLLLLKESLKLADRKDKLDILKEENEQSFIAKQALKDYIYLNDDKAFLEAHIAYGTNLKGDSFFEEILYAVSDLLKMSIRREEILPKDSWITLKLKKSAGYFYVKQYHMTIKDCEEILLIDDKNHMAMVRAGSAYYMLGEKEKAKEYYEKALSINSNDHTTLMFMKSQGWK